MIGGSSLSIGLTLFLRDQFSGPAGRIRNSSRELQQEIQRQQDQLRQQRNLNMGLAFGGAMALRGFGRQIKKAADYRYEMQFVKSLTQSTGEEQKKLMDVAEKLAGKTMFFPQDIAEGMRFMAMAGMEAEQVINNINGAVNLAGSTMSQLGGKGGAADIMTNVMKQFNIEFKHSEQVADLLSYGVTRANTNLFDLSEALKYSGSTAMDLNVSLEESIAMVMALGNAQIQGSMAGVAMENSMRYLARAFSSFGSGPSQRALSELGLSIEDMVDSKGNMLSMVQVIKKIGFALEALPAGTGNMEKQGMLQTIFGVRGKRAGSLLIRNLQEFEKFAGDIGTKSAGHSGTIMKEMMSTLRGEMDKLTSEWQSFWIAFTTAIEPSLKFLLKAVRGITMGLSRLFKIPFVGEFLSSAIISFVAINTAIFAIRGVMAGLRLIHHQAVANMVLLRNTGVGAWNSMAAAASRYGAVVSATQYSQYAGMAAAGKLKGLTVNKGGRIINATTKRFVSGSAAGMVAGGMSRVVGGKVVAAGVGRFALGRIAGILGGPMGLALTFVLPGLIGMAVRAIKGNKDSTEENTKALKKKAVGEMKVERGDAIYEHAIRFMGLADTGRVTTGITGPGFQTDDGASLIAKKLEELLSTKTAQPLVLNINIDGETIFTQHIANYLQKQTDNTERNIGVY